MDEALFITIGRRLSAGGLSERQMEAIARLDDAALKVFVSRVPGILASLALLVDRPIDPYFGSARKRMVVMRDLRRRGVVSYGDLVTRFDWSVEADSGDRNPYTLKGASRKTCQLIRTHLIGLGLVADDRL